MFDFFLIPQAIQFHTTFLLKAHPTLRDIDNQLDYQVQLRGTSEATYSPCLAIICSPYDKKSPALDSKMMAFWVVPPSEEKKILEYGRPMMMHYNPIIEKNLSSEFQPQAESIVQYYRSFRSLLDLNLTFKDKISYFDALKTSMLARIPQSENKESFWNWIRDVLNIKRVVPLSPDTNMGDQCPSKKEENPLMRELIEQNNTLLEPPKDVKEEQAELKNETTDDELKANETETKIESAD